MDPKKVATLKRTLLEATDLSEIVGYYFREFGNDPAFARSGEPIDDVQFTTMLAQVAVRTIGGKGGVFQGTAARVAEHRLIHGAFSLDAWTMMMFYFEDIEQGFMALGDDKGPSHFARFSLAKSPDGQPIVMH